MKKVYFVNGFLEAGKTTFIKELLSRDYFDTGEKTLVLLCEDGLEEYTDDFCREHHLTVEMIEDEEAFTDEKLKEAEQRTNPERMEYVTRYKNKIVSFTGKIFKKRENMLLIGRKALTCCSEDLTMFAFICDARDVGGFEEYEWVRVDGQVKAEYFEKLQAAIPIIQIIWIEKCQKPDQEVVNIY